MHIPLDDRMVLGRLAILSARLNTGRINGERNRRSGDRDGVRWGLKECGFIASCLTAKRPPE